MDFKSPIASSCFLDNPAILRHIERSERRFCAHAVEMRRREAWTVVFDCAAFAKSAQAAPLRLPPLDLENAMQIPQSGIDID
jgi:hypothetical protein